jgi:hypothetical protein
MTASMTIYSNYKWFYENSQPMNFWYESKYICASKFKFFSEQIEYLVLGYWIIKKVIQPIHNKVETQAILNIKAPKTRKEDRTTPFYWYHQLL